MQVKTLHATHPDVVIGTDTAWGTSRYSFIWAMEGGRG
jgi:5-keto 4-deoxyuronate isomerase